MRAQSEELAFTFESGDGKSQNLVFAIHQLPPISALKLASKLGRILGPAIGDLVGATQGGPNASVDLARLGTGLQKVCEDLDDAQIEALMGGLLQACYIVKDGNPSQVTKDGFNGLFTGHLRESFQLLIAIARFNFADLFPGSVGSPK